MTRLPAADKSVVATLSDVCLAIGREVPRWTQGAGGNVSLKARGSLWIKASGCRLDQAGKSLATLASLDLAALQARLAVDKDPPRVDLPDGPNLDATSELCYAETLASLSDPRFGRASMETGFHALLPKPFVAHFHALSALVMACVAKSQPKRWAQFCDSQATAVPARLDFVQPGLRLSKAVSALPPFEICLLENHGVILHATDAAVLSQWAAFEKAFCVAWGLHQLVPDGGSLDLTAYRRGPWKILFPDAAVFSGRVAALRQATEGSEWSMAEDAMTRDQAATELWIATQVLQRAWPSMAALPAETVRELTRMPAEMWRQKQQALPRLSP